MRLAQRNLMSRCLCGLGVLVACTLLVSSPSGLLGAGAPAVPAAAPASVSQPDDAARARAVESYGKLPLSFELNNGQTDQRVKFVSRGSGYTLFLTSNEAVLALRTAASGKQKTVNRNEVAAPRLSSEAPAFPVSLEPPVADPGSSQSQLGRRKPQGQKADPVLQRQVPAPDSESPASAILRMKLVGANPAAEISGLEQLPGTSNYFIGNDPKKWRTAVPNYAKVRYQDVYPGVDLVYYGNQRQLEYDFVVAPGADPGAIKLDFAGSVGAPGKKTPRASLLKIDRNGDLVVRLNGTEVSFHKPTAYQLRSNHKAKDMVAAGYVLRANSEVGIRLSPYDHTRALTIDPILLVYSSYVGGSYGDWARDIAVDGSGNAYVAGVAASPDFPIVNQIPGACRGYCGTGGYEAFVAKINAAGTALVYSSYIGGSDDDFGNAIAVDSLGNAYVAGSTKSTDFPTLNQVPGACQGSCGGGGYADAFVTKINAAGSALVYSSYIGGSGDDSGYSIAVDSLGGAYLTGITLSSDFPIVNQIPGACRGSCGTGEFYFVVFVTKINAAGSALDYSSLLGGSGGDQGEGIAVDTSGNTYVMGTTFSSDFPIVNQIPGACRGSCGSGDGSEVFVTKINAAASALVYSSYIGGSAEDLGSGIALDSSDSAYVTGETYSSDFPTVDQIPGACRGSCGTGVDGDAFVTKIDAAGSALTYSSYLGGSARDGAYAIAVDGFGSAYVTGDTFSTDFPIVNQIPGACRGSCGTGSHVDIMVTKINAAGSALAYSSYIGGSSDDEANAIAVDDFGNAYVTGLTSSSDFPTVNQIPGACRGACGSEGGYDVFVTRILYVGPNAQPHLTRHRPSTPKHVGRE